MLPDSENSLVSIISFRHLYHALACTKTFLLKTERPLISTGSLGSQDFLFAYFNLSFFVCFQIYYKAIFPPVSRTNKETITWWLSIYILSVCNVSRVSWKLIKGKKPAGLAALGTGVWWSGTGVWPFGKAAFASGRTPGWEEAGHSARSGMAASEAGQEALRKDMALFQDVWALVSATPQSSLTPQSSFYSVCGHHY